MKIIYKPLLVFTLCTPMIVQADDDEPSFSSRINIEQQASAGISGSSSTFKQKRTQIEIDKRFDLDDINSFSIGLGLEQIDITSNAVLPGSNATIPEEIKGAMINLGWTHVLKSGQEFNLSGVFGSVSDKPFEGSNALSQELEVSFLMPTNAGNAWLVGMGYDDEDGINWIPNIAYQWNKSERFQAVIGLPFIELTWQPYEEVEVMAMLVDKGTELSTILHLNEDTSITLSHGQGGWSARRFGRSDKKAFMNYEETRTALSLNKNFGPTLVSLTGGLITDRKLNENKGDSKNNSDLNIKDTRFIALNIGVEF